MKSSVIGSLYKGSDTHVLMYDTAAVQWPMVGQWDKLTNPADPYSAWESQSAQTFIP